MYYIQDPVWNPLGGYPTEREKEKERDRDREREREREREEKDTQLLELVERTKPIVCSSVFLFSPPAKQ